MLTAEISCIYSKKGKVRKVHNLVFSPDIGTVTKINKALSRIGNLSSDGRPILGLDAKELLRIVLDISDRAMLVPAHIWTPHFSVLGAASGFESLEECFEELTPHIHAVETGLSSDPAMNRRLPSLDRITLISNSDAHSPAKLGREANILESKGREDISYDLIMNAIKTGIGFAGTIEFFPEEGKYHYDGHRHCGVSLSPEETLRHNYLCPVCGKKVTVGVMHRVEKLAARKPGYIPDKPLPFYSIIPLQEILSEVLKVGVNSKAVMREYMRLLDCLGPEFTILMDTPPDTIEEKGSPLLREAIERMRSGQVHAVPGYDGEYGKVSLFEHRE
ncbi:MAG TPA: endonuclease Q family protein [Thermodesulfovibrionales bacterium]|nr:endonuclease Q family protein [Thermodesulfovibrionales bacterium]